MTLCEDGHGEVCFDSRYCPACAAIREMEKSKDSEISGLNDEIKELHAKVEELEGRE